MSRARSQYSVALCVQLLVCCFLLVPSPGAENRAPSISPFANLVIAPGDPIPKVPFTISDPETAAEDLTITVGSTNTILLPADNIQVTGTGNERNLLILPAPDRIGATVVNVTVTDPGGATATAQFKLTIESFTLVKQFNGESGGLNGVRVGDTDGNGFLDVLSPFALFRNDSDFRFSKVSSTKFVIPTWIDLFDEDRNGRLDLIIAGENSNQVNSLVGLNANTTNLSPLPGVFGVGDGAALAWGDVDNDGRSDLLISGIFGLLRFGPSMTALFHNDIDGNFTRVPILLPQVSSGAVSFADYDSDGNTDFVVSGQTNSSRPPIFILYHNDGHYNFSTVATPIPGLTRTSIAWGDIDGDGDLDLAVCGMTNSSEGFAAVYLNNAGSFSKLALDLPALANGTVIWCDFNNDGKLDLLLSGQNLSGSGVQAIYLNLGAKHFS
jgi:hypothetical protein